MTTRFGAYPRLLAMGSAVCTLLVIPLLIGAMYLGDTLLGGDALLYIGRQQPGQPATLYIHDLNSDVRLIVRDDLRGNQLTADWSPDGNEIVYTSARPAMPHARNLYVTDLAGNRQRIVSVDDSLTNLNSPAWSPDGTTIAYEAVLDGSQVIMLHDLAAGRSSRLMSAIFAFHSPAWSPDGERLAVQEVKTPRTVNLRVHEMDSGRSYTVGGEALDRFWPRWPVWMPDETILYVAQTDHPAPTNLNLWQVEPDTDAVRRLTNFEAFDLTQPDLSPDGSRLAYIRRKAGIHVINLDNTSASSPITHEVGTYHSPRFRPR